ncbi:methionine synthase reductase isoform X2 [Hyposmocoma kahamanoa]|uniref:methionine synthase reductase isoform X2 n=1 Tax=Hyposmocoma kahamanoa TaxID=1477025 RepID=UPI000E6D9DE5|nr:methionine synthase reductase isoform X2 [Hyposmocoma kahamanoa]
MMSGEYHVGIKEWRRLTAIDEGCKPVYEVTFDVTGSNLSFSPGDTIGIIPHNPTSDVDFIISHLCLQAHLTYVLSVKSLKGKIPAYIPVRSTLWHVLTHCVDLRGVLKKVFILALSRHTKEESERRVLEYFCSKEGSYTYTTHILNKRICILDIFSIFKSCKPPIEVLLAYLPRLLPRAYSIVNSNANDPHVIKICFSVMHLGNNRKGLTTSWLENIILSSTIEHKMENLNISESNVKDCKVPIYLRDNLSGFTMPQDLSTPLILIGPGTGVSPFIGFLEERSIRNDKKSSGKTWLFFGCRNPKLDFIYEKELNFYKENGTLDKLTVAFSRVEDSPIRYIQDALLLNGEELVNLINGGASIFVCGDLNTMALQIKQVFVKCLVKYDDKTQEEAEKFVTDLQKEKRYFVDAWS